MQGGKPRHRQLGQRNKGNMEIGAGNESLPLHFFKTGFQPFTGELIVSLCPIQRNRKLQRKKGAPVSYMVAWGGRSGWGCCQETSLAKLRRGLFLSCLLSEEVTCKQRANFHPRETVLKEARGRLHSFQENKTNLPSTSQRADSPQTHGMPLKRNLLLACQE